MKRFMTILLASLMLFCTVGVHVNAHYCGGEYMGSVVNGIALMSQKAQSMPGCMDGESMTCKHCNDVHHDYRLASQLLRGQSVESQPLLCSPDWFHGYMPEAMLATVWIETPISPTETPYRPPHPDPHLWSPSGLRAPPESLSV